MSLTDSKRFIYLVQGQADLVQNYAHIATRPSSHLVSLTYDKPLEGSIYFPNSTWAEGRNRLLEEVEKLQYEYEYLVYCDDDVLFYMGGWDEFESRIWDFKPAVAVPVVSRTVRTIDPFPLFDVQRFTYNDEQIMAIRKDVILGRKIVPYKTEFDSLHWWATCYAQEVLIQNYYSNDTLQINTCRVFNLEHDRYTSDEAARRVYKTEVVNRLQSECRVKILDESPNIHVLNIRTLFENLTSFGTLISQLARNLLKNLAWLHGTQACALEELMGCVLPNKKYAIYGFGKLGQDIHRLFTQSGATNQIVSVLDQRAYLGISEVDSIPIIPPSHLKLSEDMTVILASYGSITEMIGFLRDVKGIKPSQIIQIKNSTQKSKLL